MIDEPASDSIGYYDDDGDCEDCDNPINEYDEEYEDTSSETITELFNYCLMPSINDTFKYLLPLLLLSILFRLLAQNRYSTPTIFHALSTVIGLFVLQHYVPESLNYLLYFIILSYFSLRLSKFYHSAIKTFLPSLLLIFYCEYSMDPATWHKVRGVIMIAAMRAISVEMDESQAIEFPGILEYGGYMLGAATSLFGPWISFKEYLSLTTRKNQWNFWWILESGWSLLVSFFFLSISNCWAQWFLTDRAGKWFLAYRDALAFRASHYFIAYATSSVLILGGYRRSLVSIAKPLEIELPRSLVQVVVSWNIPMHNWLKLYIFRPARRRLGKFSAVVLTYLASSLLHGLNFQLAAVLLSLGFYTFVEFELRNVFAETFDACVAAKKCPETLCEHGKKSSNCWWVALTNLAFSVLAIFHLAYLGLMFDTSEIQETGYSYEHTIDKWSHLGFASHWVALATYITYFLIR